MKRLIKRKISNKMKYTVEKQTEKYNVKILT